VANGKKTDQQRIDAAERRQQALELRKAGASYRAIGAQLNISEKTAHQDVQRALDYLADLELASAAELRTMELLRLDKLTLEASRILAATHPLISGGKVLSRYTNDGKAIGLTDDGPKLQAIDRLLRISESRRKLLGLDAQPDTLILGDVEITIRWPNDRTTIDVTPTTDDPPAAALPGPAAGSEEQSTLPDRVSWTPLWEE